MPPLSKKRRYAKSAMSRVGRDISTGLFQSLKASALIVIEDDEIEKCTYDIWVAQLHNLSDNSSDDEDNVSNLMWGEFLITAWNLWLDTALGLQVLS